MRELGRRARGRSPRVGERRSAPPAGRGGGEVLRELGQVRLGIGGVDRLERLARALVQPRARAVL